MTVMKWRQDDSNNGRAAVVVRSLESLAVGRVSSHGKTYLCINVGDVAHDVLVVIEDREGGNSLCMHE